MNQFLGVWSLPANAIALWDVSRKNIAGGQAEFIKMPCFSCRCFDDEKQGVFDFGSIEAKNGK